MNFFSEIKELSKEVSSFESNKIKAFENIESDNFEKNIINTMGQQYEGKVHPITGVPFKSQSVFLDGRRIEGVFPVFESKAEVHLPKNLWNASDVKQAEYCTQVLKLSLKWAPRLRENFDKRQISQIDSGSDKISGYVWHKSEIPGKMQLVDERKHNLTPHTGGEVIWGDKPYY